MKCKVCNTYEAEVCIQCKNLNSVKRHKIFKQRVYKQAGGRCEGWVNHQRCQETERACLTVHHLDKKNHPYDVKYAKLLCLNCHWGREHKQGRDD